jgi:hypothetical protein
MGDEDDELGWFLELPTYEFPALGDEEAEPEPLPAAAEAAWRLWLDPAYSESDETFEEYFKRFLDTVDPAGIRELIFGSWAEVHQTSSAELVKLLVEAAPRLTALRGLAIGDVAPEEVEISWIRQSDLTPVLDAFPRLEVLEIRGSEGLELRPARHAALRVLRIEAGSLPGQVIRSVGAAELPRLEHLELWLGVRESTGAWQAADFDGILSGERLPALRDLGLQNSDLQDEVAALVAAAPVVARLESLALSMGVLTDEGAQALLSGRPLTHLKELDLHHNYLSEEMVERLRAALPGVSLDV